MSSSDSENSCEYADYKLKVNVASPPLIKKKSRLIAAVVNNHMEILMDLLDSPRWYNVRDKYGYSLLQIAIRLYNKEVFDYLLSIPDFPLEYVNKNGHTALLVALPDLGFNNSCWQYFACQLIRRGACIDKVCSDGNGLLIRALEFSYHELAKLLILKGADVNLESCRGQSPLTIALMSHNYHIPEIIATLLAYKAVPLISNFENSVLCHHFEVQEALFLHIFDEYSCASLRIDVLLKLAELKSTMFYQLLQYPIKMTIPDKYDLAFFCFRTLCSMRTDRLSLVVQKFSPCIKETLLKPLPKDADLCWTRVCADDRIIRLENLQIMLDCELKPAVISIISIFNQQEFFPGFLRYEYDEMAITQLYCYLLSYGLKIHELDLQCVYERYGYCELFKILLHMDVEMGIPEGCGKHIMPVLLYDVRMTLDKFFQEYYDYFRDSTSELLHYFVHPKLNEICYHVDKKINYTPGEGSQQIPLLVELARNAFRKFFIKKFKIKTSKELYSRLNWLPINNVYKKIITYETKLY